MTSADNCIILYLTSTTKKENKMENQEMIKRMVNDPAYDSQVVVGMLNLLEGKTPKMSDNQLRIMKQRLFDLNAEIKLIF